MDAFVVLTVAAILLGAAGVLLFFWTLRSGQYEDLDGAAHRILIDDEDDDASAHRGLSRDDRAVGVPRRVSDQRKDDDQADE
jgi:cbb3-type cytochrome oxidase maturation protein